MVGESPPMEGGACCGGIPYIEAVGKDMMGERRGVRAKVQWGRASKHNDRERLPWFLEPPLFSGFTPGVRGPFQRRGPNNIRASPL